MLVTEIGMPTHTYWMVGEVYHRQMLKGGPVEFWTGTEWIVIENG